MQERVLLFDFDCLKEKLKNHLASPLEKSEVSVSYYDMAWLLRLENPDNPEVPLFPQYLERILNAQLSTGSWEHNPHAAYRCDGLLTSLSAVLALAQWQSLDARIPQSIEKGISAINTLLKDADKDAYKSVGFEMLLPALLEEALDNELPILVPAEIEKFIIQRQRKLAAFPLELLYQKPTTILHSLEAFYKIPLDWQKLSKTQDKNGAFLSSPAATAKVYQETGNPEALAYLMALVEADTIPVNTPIDIFEINWALEMIYQLGLSKTLGKSYQDGIAMLQKHWTAQGLSWSSQFNLPDLDNSSVAFYLLSLAGHAPKSEVFQNFYDEQRIFCFYGELDSSPTHLLHFLQALSWMPEAEALRERVLEKLLTLFEQNHWRDKWHLSPYYTIALSIQPLAQLHPQTVDTMLDYLLENQVEGWGIDRITLEETAWACYALYQALDNLSFREEKRAKLESALETGLNTLRRAYQPEAELEALWIDKCLYCPYSIVHSLITALLLRAVQDKQQGMSFETGLLMEN